MKLAMYQNKNAGSIEKNLENSLKAIQEASQQGVDCILFPEVQLTEFFSQYPKQDVEHYAITLEDEIVQKFCACCKENKIMAIPNIYLKENGKNYDASLLINQEGKIVGIQKMVHVAYADQFFETDYYTPANDGFKVFDTEFGKIGIVVCFDRHYPESIRTEALMGADLILIPTVNTKQEPMELFEQEIRVQAFQNSVFVAMANRVGTEDAMDFAGESLIVSPLGQTLIKADDQEGLVIYDLKDIQEAGKVRSQKPYTTLRRVEFYR